MFLMLLILCVFAFTQRSNTSPQLTRLENGSFLDRLRWHFRRGIAYISGRPPPPPYVAHRRKSILDLGYLILEYVSDGQMLSASWDKNRPDLVRRSNLFRGLSRIMLGLAAHPLDRIGAWTMDDLGRLSLTNRPLTFHLLEQESRGIPTDIPRHRTYVSAASYYLDLLACQDNRLRHQPNSIHDEDDGRAQLAALTAMRALLPKFSDRQLCDEAGFVLALTDLHPSNIFVDEHWNITRIIDLEWACVRPLEMLGPPSWLSGHSLDEIRYKKEDEYAALHAEFVQRFREEEEKAEASAGCRLMKHTQMLQRCWDTGAFWYFNALDAPSALLDIFTDHIQPRFSAMDSRRRREFDRVVAPLWDVGASHFLADKIKQQEQYADQLRNMFLAGGVEDGKQKAR